MALLLKIGKSLNLQGLNNMSVIRLALYLLPNTGTENPG